MKDEFGEAGSGEGIRRLSLSVDSRNNAAAFYNELGFIKVSESGASWTMLTELEG